MASLQDDTPRTNIPIDWDKIAVRIGIIISFLTIVGFLISLAFNIVSLGEKVGILEGQMQIILPKQASSSATLTK